MATSYSDMDLDDLFASENNGEYDYSSEISDEAAPVTQPNKIDMYFKCIDRHRITSYFHRTRPKPEPKAAPKTIQPFLSLPLEMREKIYHYYIEDRRQCCMDCRALPSRPVVVSESFPPIITLSSLEPALARTCCQVRNELLAIFYSDRSFRFTVHQWHLVCMLTSWRKLLGDANALRVRRLVFYLNGNRGWQNARILLEWMENNMSPDCRFFVVGDSFSMCTAFQTSCEIGTSLRSGGLPWDIIEENLDKMCSIMFAAGYDGIWVDPEDGEDIDWEDEEENDHHHEAEDIDENE